jgi:hypothetical protein
MVPLILYKECYSEIWRYDLEIWVTLVLREKKHRGQNEFVLKIQSVEIQTHAECRPHTSPSEWTGHRGAVSPQLVV